MVGRIESYVHSDSTTPNKGGILVKVTSDTDFGGKTQEFIAFTRRVARLAYAANAATWEEAIEMFPELEDHRKELEGKLREKVAVENIAILLL